MLPKGKLGRHEDALTAARREVLEETGHHVTVHDFLGTVSYDVRRGSKVVQFWHMTITDEPPRKLTRDVRRIEWLTPAAAVAKLSHPRERAFLAQVAPVVFGHELQARPGLLQRLWTWLRRRFDRERNRGRF
jgi:8-oxo-dGTP diphosphatase